MHEKWCIYRWLAFCMFVRYKRLYRYLHIYLTVFCAHLGVRTVAELGGARDSKKILRFCDSAIRVLL